MARPDPASSPSDQRQTAQRPQMATDPRSTPLPGLVRALPPERHALIAGPTASGKSALALEIAASGGGVIVNADALQVYDCWHILTARPGARDLARAPHRLYGHVACDATYSVGLWLREVAALLETGARLIITGGTGLYFTALTEGLAQIPEVPPAIRAEGRARLAHDGIRALAGALDAATRARLDVHNPARVLRAWEVLKATGRSLTDWQRDTPAPLLGPNDTERLVLTPDPAWLTRRIDQRFDAMMAAGALDEARARAPSWDPAHPSARAIGAAELIAHLDGEMSLDVAVSAAKSATRQYAKRQRTWFRNRLKDWQQIRPDTMAS